MKKIKLAVIFGGRSGEHKVSLSSAREVINNLNLKKYDVLPILIEKNGNWLVGKESLKYLNANSDKNRSGNIKDLKEGKGLIKMVKEKVDLVLPLTHGPFGEDGRLQGMLDMFSIPYVFSGVLAHAIGMNKAKAKIIAKHSSVKVAKDLVIKKDDYKFEDIIKNINLPVVIKPLELGSSVGVSIIRNKSELEKGVKNAFKHGKEIILEQYIKGREFTVAVMGNRSPRVLAVTEIVPIISDFYDYKAKYEVGGSRHICPARISTGLKNKLEKYAIETFKAIGCNDLARVDFIYDEKNKEAYFIDINTIPGMTSTSLAPEAARYFGLNFSQFLDNLISLALRRVRRERKMK